jgi:hypothetical protein
MDRAQAVIFDVPDGGRDRPENRARIVRWNRPLRVTLGRHVWTSHDMVEPRSKLPSQPTPVVAGGGHQPHGENPDSHQEDVAVPMTLVRDSMAEGGPKGLDLHSPVCNFTLRNHTKFKLTTILIRQLRELSELLTSLTKTRYQVKISRYVIPSCLTHPEPGQRESQI